MGARLMIIGQNPDRLEIKERKPFVGPAGEMVTYMLDTAGLDRSDVYLAGAVKCGTTNNRAPHEEEIRTCFSTWLMNEIKALQPEVILLLGKVAFTSVVQNRRPFKHGEVFENKRYKFIASWHPSYCLRAGKEADFVEGIGSAVASLLDGEELPE